MKGQLSILIAVLVLGALGYYAAFVRPERVGNDAATGGNGQDRMAQPYTFRTEKIKEESVDLKYKIDVEYPVLYGGFDVPRTKINTELKSGLDHEIALFKQTAADLRDVNVPDDLPASEFAMRGTVITATSSILSIRFENYSYIRGAAHPLPYVLTYTFDAGVEGGARLALKDLFTPGSNYLKRISDIAIARLLGDYSDDENEEYVRASVEDGAGPEEENFKEFTVTEEGLRIIFNPYQVGPYAIGIPEIEIARKDIQDIINLQGPARFIWQ